MNIDEEIAKVKETLDKLILLKSQELEKKVITIKVSDMTYKYLKVFTPYDDKIREQMSMVPSRFWSPVDKSFSVQTKDYPNMIKGLKSLDKVEIVYEPERIEKELEDLFNSPNLSTTLNTKTNKIDIILNKLTDSLWLSNDLDSWTQLTPGKYQIDKNELWRFAKVVSIKYPSLTLKYDDSLLVLLKEQNDRRDKLTSLSNAEDYKIDVPLIGGEKFMGFQRVALAFAEALDYNGILALDMGLGKTPISIAIAETLIKKNPDARVLFVVPATLKTNTFREIKKWTGKEALMLSGASPSSADLHSLIIKKTQYNIINYDVVGRETKTEDEHISIMKWVELLNASKFSLIVGDELHYIKNTGALRSKGMRALEAPHKIGLTGTPIVNRPGELYAPLNFISPDNFASEDRFKNSYLTSKGEAKNMPRLREILQDYMFRRKKEDVIKDLPPITRIEHYTELSDKARAHYTKALEGLYIALRNPNYQREITNILTELMRLKQIISDDKISSTVELALLAQEETEKKVLIFSQFVDCCRAISSELPNSLCITGQNSDEERYDRIDKFQNDDKYKFMVLSTKAGAEGITLTQAHTVIFNDLCWTPKDHRQAEARCYGRMSDMHGAVAYYVQASDTIDELLATILLKKMHIIEEIVDKVNDREEGEGSVVSELIKKLLGGLK